MNNKIATIEDAIEIAAQAHREQKDKAGAAYILHPLRMMMRMKTEAEMITSKFDDANVYAPFYAINERFQQKG